MERTIKIIIQFRIILFIPFFILFTSAEIFSQLLDIDMKIKEARSNYLLQDYTQTITILSELKKYVDESTNLEAKNEVLAEIYFLYGACFVGWNREGIARVQFKNALELHPTYEIDDEIYNEKLAKIFIDVKQNENYEIPIEPIESKNPDTGKIVILDHYVKVVKSNATLMLYQDKDSTVLMKIPVGAMLDVEQIEREWIKVSLLPNKDGIIITGYIHISFIEVEPKLYKKK